MPEDTDNSQPDSPDAFLRLLTENERALALYVHGLIPQIADAQDILQETKILLWKKFESFEPGTNFLAWGRKIAFHQILNHRRGQKRRHRFSEAFLQSVAAEIEKSAPELDRRSDHLSTCLRKLKEGNRRLVLMRYFEDLSIEEISDTVGKTPDAVYRALSRIRQSLHTCVTRELQHLPGAAS